MAINTVVEVSLDEFDIHDMDSHIIESVETKIFKELHDGNVLFYVYADELHKVSTEIEKLRVAAKQFHDAGGHEAYWARIEQEEREVV